MKKPAKKKVISIAGAGDYAGLVGGISELLDAARRASARAVNAFMTASYWEIGRRIVEFEQGGKGRAEYGLGLLKRLAKDLTVRGSRGFSVDNLENMRLFYGICGTKEISETLSRKLAASKLLVREYLTALPDEKVLATELETTRSKLEGRFK
jgi:hypothetical protein